MFWARDPKPYVADAFIACSREPRGQGSMSFEGLKWRKVDLKCNLEIWCIYYRIVFLCMGGN